MGDRISIRTPDGDFSAYVARPAAEKAPAIVVIQEIFGVNPVMRDIFRMRYLWRHEMELVDPRLDSLLGPGFLTPFEDAVAATVTGLVATPKAA